MGATRRRHHVAGAARRTARVASSGALAVTVLGAGSLLSGEHLPGISVGVDRAALTLGTGTPAQGSIAALAAVVPAPDETVPVDVSALVKAVTLVERQQTQAALQRQTDTQRQRAAPGTSRARTTASTCAAGDTGFETVKSWVSRAGAEMRCRFDVDAVYGVAGRSGASDHPSGLALDLMVDRNPGDDLAAYAVQNMDRLGISYVIYRQRINFGSGWQAMEDRGGVTANHMDHVHVSFDSR